MLKVIPLGGLDAIGKNMTVFECGDDIVLDDAGCMFPDDNHPGIDLILPDYSYLLQNAEKLRGIVITHGHEDHTGALPYVMKDLDCEVPIYGTKMTLGLIEGKFKEHHVKNAKLIEIKPGQSIKMGCFTANFFAVNHSIPGSVGIFLNSPAGNVLHTGDFKLDQTPIDGITTDFGAIAEYSRIGVDLLMSDSTNANIPTFTPSEAEVGKVLNRIIAQADGPRGHCVVRQPHSPHAADLRRRHRERPQGRRHRPINGAEHGYRAPFGLPAHLGRQSAGCVLYEGRAARAGGGHVHWQPGRAAVSACTHCQRQP